MTLDRHDRWYDFAACRGQAPLFDAPTHPHGFRTATERASEDERVHRAKLICGRCSVIQQCADDALPGCDEGIRAGQMLPPIDKPRGHVYRHGTEGGYKTHKRRGEKPCYECREANRLARQGRGWQASA